VSKGRLAKLEESNLQQEEEKTSKRSSTPGSGGSRYGSAKQDTRGPEKGVTSSAKMCVGEAGKKEKERDDDKKKKTWRTPSEGQGKGSSLAP